MKRHRKVDCRLKKFGSLASSSSTPSDVPFLEDSRAASPGFLNPSEAFSPVQSLPEDSSVNQNLHSVTPTSSHPTDEQFKSPLPVCSSPLPSQRLKRPTALKSLFPKGKAAMHKGTPPKLLYREEEKEKICLWLTRHLEENSGGSFYISGSPGKLIHKSSTLRFCLFTSSSLVLFVLLLVHCGSF